MLVATDHTDKKGKLKMLVATDLTD